MLFDFMKTDNLATPYTTTINTDDHTDFLTTRGRVYLTTRGLFLKWPIKGSGGALQT